MGTFKFKETLIKKKKKRAPIPSPAANRSSSALASSDENAPLLAANDAEAQVVQPSHSSIRDLLTPTVVRVMTTNFFMCLSVSMADQIYPIFAATSTADGGLGFEARNIGFSLAISGLSIFYLQLVVYPRLERKYGALFCYQRGQLLITIPFAGLSLLSILAAHLEKLAHGARPLRLPDVWNMNTTLEYLGLWVLLIALLLTQMVAKVMALTSINLITANLAPSRTELGFMNGMQQMAMTTTRIIGPLITGLVWTWSIKHSLPFPFDSHFVWTIATAFTLTSYFMSRNIPQSVNSFAAGKVNDGDEEAT
ncbi:hypothetical protein GGI23_003298 [Coemansia sp. RSA 2559]|nr:hypothetical protein GGI23_003298 [Coemansia sp. RSA 2559]